MLRAPAQPPPAPLPQTVLDESTVSVNHRLELLVLATPTVGQAAAD
jgi:hypothetical protein